MLDQDDLKAITRLIKASEKKAKKGITVSHWDAPNDFKPAQERMISEELARSLRRQGRADIREVVSNPDPNEFPDCSARLDSASIGIEVTELIDPHTQFSEWPLDRFQRCLAMIISKKDAKAERIELAQRLALLEQIWLVIATDEALLTPKIIEDHLSRIRLPRPIHLSAVFVLGYQPTDNPVMRGTEHEPEEEQARWTAFEVQWTDEP